MRLTPAGQRLADHAVTILAAVDARPPGPRPGRRTGGTCGSEASRRGSGFAAADLAELAARHPAVDVVISEYEPIEAFALLADDDLDLALTYDYNLAPASPESGAGDGSAVVGPWGLGVPAMAPDGPADIADYAVDTWIVNSRNTADEDAVRTLASLAGFIPRIAHQIDSLELVEDLIIAGTASGYCRSDRPTRAGVKVLPLPGRRSFSPPTQRRGGRATWPPLRAVLDRLRPPSGAKLPRPKWPRPVPGP